MSAAHPPTRDGRAPGDLALECRGLRFTYRTQPVLADVSLELSSGQLLAILGPSGSGKTTLLYAIAGFVEPSAGQIVIGGRTAFRAGRDGRGPAEWLPPEEREIGFVFQHYALWPHLTALETVAYPLRRQGMASEEAERRAGELLARMGIGDLGSRRPAELSGGQQQRVGLARALARRPRLFLFDEPTAHLDTALRASLQEELAQRQRESGTAALYATHDAAEALATADRVALIHAGQIVQVGTPREVYEQPTSGWAAELTGRASVLRISPAARLPSVDPPAERPAAILVRPEWASLGGQLQGRVARVLYRGTHAECRLQTEWGDLVVSVAAADAPSEGGRVGWSLNRHWPLPGEGDDPGE